jgi:hypothetical protein
MNSTKRSILYALLCMEDDVLLGFPTVGGVAPNHNRKVDNAMLTLF